MLFRNFVGDTVNPYFVECVLRGTLRDNQERLIPCVNVFNFRRLTNGTTFDPTNVVAKFLTDIQSALLDACNVRYNLDQGECRAMDDPASASAIQPVDAPGTVGNDDSAYTAANAVYWLLRTGFRGRSFKGSKHFGGTDEAFVTQDELNATGQSAWEDVMNAVSSWSTSGMTDSDGNVWHWCIISRELSSLGPTDIPAIFTGADVSEVLLNKTVGTMRHRKEKTVR